MKETSIPKPSSVSKDSKSTSGSEAVSLLVVGVVAEVVVAVVGLGARRQKYMVKLMVILIVMDLKIVGSQGGRMGTLNIVQK